MRNYRTTALANIQRHNKTNRKAVKHRSLKKNSHDRIVHLQEAMGNRAFGQMLQAKFDTARLDQQEVDPTAVEQAMRTPIKEALSTVATTNVNRKPDDVPDRQEVGNQFYAHGGFMGAARRMLNDPKWNRILQTLMPDVYADVQDVSDESELIPMFENNPVMAAYGMFKTRQLDLSREGGRSDRIENMKAFEWDVFLDSDVTRAYSVAFTEETNRALDRRLVDTMIIAHGNTKDTIDEALGSPQYNDVKRTRKTGMGGATTGAWMDLFGRALRIATADNPDELMTKMRREARRTDEDDQSLYQTFERQMGFREVIDLYKQTFGKETFSVLLDVKSRNAKPHILRKVIRELNRRGVHVYGVGTFTFSELDNLDEVNQIVGGKDMGAAHGIKFFHGIGNLQTACTDGEVLEGDTVMFNAGSILDSVDWDADDPDTDDEEIEEIIRNLAEFKNAYRFHLGLYIQEGATDQRAARKITMFSNQHADIFDLGFGWGGISNDMGPVNEGDTGIGSQRWIPWNEWDEDKKPGTPPSIGFKSTFRIKRFLESRKFEVKRGRVIVSAYAEWDSDPAPVNSFTITLRQSDLFTDTTYTRYSFTTGERGEARWDGLEGGTYYLEIDIPNQEHAALYGEINVSF